MTSWYKTCQARSVSLWLDDIRPKPTDYTVHAKTAQEAIQILEQGNVRKASLDHDLGPEDTGVGTGYDVAKWIEEAAFHNRIPRIDILVHSQNPVGIIKMQQCIENAKEFWNEHEEEEWSKKEDGPDGLV